MGVELLVNGTRHVVDVPADTSLLHVLRTDLHLFGTRFGCGLGQCGACFVLLEGRPALSCQTPVWAAEGRAVQTVEGLARDGHLHPLQQAFLDEQAAQCGYCISGVLVRAAALLAENPEPDEDQIAVALDQNLCRCGSHRRIIRAVRRAAGSGS